MWLVTKVSVLICTCIIFNKKVLACPRGCRCNYFLSCNRRNLISFPQLKTIPTDTTSLILWGNEIRNITLSKKDLTNHSQVVYLDLAFNHLTLLPTFNMSVLSAFTGLRTLYLSNNRIQDIEDQAFNGLHQLQTLYLSGNRINNKTDQTFSGLHQLQRLDLSGNRIQNIAGQAFRRLHQLQELRLQGNRVQVIEDQAFKGLYQLQDLDLMDNRIWDITDQSFSGLHQLRKLYLSNNKIQSIASQTFRGLHLLQKLDLSSNGIKDIRNGTFRDLQNLQMLDISYNRITKVVSSWFDHLTFLTHLHLENNMISSFEPYYFSWPDSLLKLYLHNNKITAFPPLPIKNCSTNTSCQGTKLYLLGNEIYCGCRRPEHDQTILNMTLPLVDVCCVDVDGLCPHVLNYKYYSYHEYYMPKYCLERFATSDNFKYNRAFSIHSYIQQPVCFKPRIDINPSNKIDACTAKGEPKPEVRVTVESIRSSDSHGTKILKTTCTASNAFGSVTKTFYSMSVSSINIPLWAMVTLCFMSFTSLIIVIAFVIASCFDNNKSEFNNEENSSDILSNSDNVSDIYDSVM